VHAAKTATVSRGASVTLRGITKRFGATQALRDVELDVRAGTIHAFVGENGAGKSTLGKIVGGIYSADDGMIAIDGAKVERWDAPTALATGIATIQQELSLVPALSVAQNVFLGIEPARYGLLTGSVTERYRELDRVVGFGLDPDVLVHSLRLADQQKVEIMRAIARDARLIVMDEPTSSLTQDEAERLYEIVDRLHSEGRTIIYVSHFLDEVLQLADYVTVMRDGAIVHSSPTEEETKASLVEGMLGQPMSMAFPSRPELPEDAPTVLEVRNLSGGLPKEITMHVRAGEIVGLAGLVGSGRTELARMLFGADPIEGGEVLLDGEILSLTEPRGAIHAGLVMLPEDRRGNGLVMTQNVRENVTLPQLRFFARRGWIRRKAERAATRKAVHRLGIVPADVDGELQYYSGGNQQKALFAKWTLKPPKVIVLDEPTRGVDIGAKKRIYKAIVEVATEGAGVILISSELEEVAELSHRAYLMDKGRLIGEVDAAEHLSADDLLKRLFDTDTDEGEE
jgi:ribose transport system ATP-binding protein